MLSLLIDATGGPSPASTWMARLRRNHRQISVMCATGVPSGRAASQSAPPMLRGSVMWSRSTGPSGPVVSRTITRGMRNPGSSRRGLRLTWPMMSLPASRTTMSVLDVCSKASSSSSRKPDPPATVRGGGAAAAGRKSVHPDEAWEGAGPFFPVVGPVARLGGLLPQTAFVGHGGSSNWPWCAAVACRCVEFSRILPAAPRPPGRELAGPQSPVLPVGAGRAGQSDRRAAAPPVPVGRGADPGVARPTSIGRG
ncbi:MULTISPECIES: hypothetical protein [Corynebacterium]|uniref:hypothetical protein n=1 Tax=Corynebacterium TaxID=1716 RepID=UPI0011602886|nr:MULTISPECIES: hypothetical protein [Corynebacterium]MCQ4616835.1 hypothetical protein [Corynebacterium pseudogenitalium]MDK8364571.1 hypothetical protein [Corynebacterium sp. UMB10119B]